MKKIKYFTKMKCTFPANFKINDLVKVLYDTNHRLAWDENLDKLEVENNGSNKEHWNEYILNK